MPGHVTHGAALRQVFHKKRTFLKCDAFSLRDRRGEGDFKELFFTFLIQIKEAQVASVALGLSCAHGHQVPLPSTDQIKARELLTSADQTQALDSGTDTSVSRPPHAHLQAQSTRSSHAFRAPSHHGPHRKCNVMGTRGWTGGDSHGQLPGVSGLSPTSWRRVRPAHWLGSSRLQKCFTYPDLFHP